MAVALPLRRPEDVLSRAGRVAPTAAAEAERVDRDGCFPEAAVDRLRHERLLGSAIPVELGGEGAGLDELVAVTTLLSRSCASTGMIYAMHQIQVLALVRHGRGSPELEQELASMARQQRLIASVTSEAGIGGDLRRSRAALTPRGDGWLLEKEAPTVSYAEHTDDFLITCRRSPDAADSDQVLVLARASDTELERRGEWNTLGMRGTASPPFSVRARIAPGHVLPAPFSQIAPRTMVPTSHILWAACWTGIASEAVARAKRLLRAKARQNPGAPPPGGLRLAECVRDLEAMRSELQHALDKYDKTPEAELESVGYAIHINNLKLSASMHVVKIVTQALRLLGMAGYSESSPFSVARHLRDAHSAALMIANDRILASNAAMALVHKGDG